jgi:uncharacterized protein YkwD
MKKIILLSVLLIVALNVLSCAPTVSQQEYERLESELSEKRSEIASLQSKLAAFEPLRSEYDRLSESYEAVSGEMEDLQDRYDELEAEYEELSDDYDELMEQYDAVMEEASIAEADVEQALFQLINAERQDKNIDLLEWDKTVHSWALTHSQHMAEEKALEYAEDTQWQEIWMAAGYSSVDRLARATMAIWKDSPGYEQSFLHRGAEIGAVAVYKSGDIYYVTYFARFY